MGRLFGTDGVRGLANAELTPETATALAAAAVQVLASPGDKARPQVVLGRDPRASGEMLEAAVCAGLTSAGADVHVAGVLPTPAVAHLVAATGADFGVMLSASHNPMPDNGVKLFGAGGKKLTDAEEDRVEATLHADRRRPVGADLGRLRTLSDGLERYVDHLTESAPHRLNGVKVVVDCAHGAASAAAPAAYRRAGAEVVAVCAEPDGYNINDGCGSTHLEVLRAAVRDNGADMGVAHDGDADRCLAVTADGTVVDGDQIMAVLAVGMKADGALANNTLVATVMSNLGLRQAMRAADIELITTGVGDRYVLEALLEGSHSLGGEQSGHIVMPQYATTGDGLLTAMHLMARVVVSGRSLSELVAVMRHAPQVLRNVPVSDKAVVDEAAVKQLVERHTAALGESGRVLLRPSGTEPLVRVMVEADDADCAAAVAEEIAAAVAAA